MPMYVIPNAKTARVNIPFLHVRYALRSHTSFPLQASAVLLSLDADQEIPAASAKLRVPELLPGIRIDALRSPGDRLRA